MNIDNEVYRLITSGYRACNICKTLNINLLNLRNIVKRLNDKYFISNFSIDDDIKYRVLELIKLKKTSIEICKELNISSVDLFQFIKMLMDDGYKFNRFYFSDGSIKYLLIGKNCQTRFNNKSNSVKLLTGIQEDEIKILVMSDIHFGNVNENLDNLKKAFDYCKKNNIHIIFNTGDFIDGTYGKSKQFINDVEDQINHFIESYPYDSHILTIGVGGGHDYSALDECGIDLLKIISEYRHDIVIPAYKDVIVKIKNDNIKLHHTLTSEIPIGIGYYCSLYLNGHLHKYVNEHGLTENNKLSICVPSISDLSTDVPSVLELTLKFYNGFIENANFKQVYFGNKDIILGEDNTKFPRVYRKLVHVDNTEKFVYNNGFDDIGGETIERENTPKKRVMSPMSQVDKFRKRYNIN